MSYQTFRYESPKAEVIAHFFTFPNLTTLGRIRLLAEGRVRFEIIKDFYFSVNVYNIYDSDPPVCVCPLGLAHFAHLIWPTLSY